jgi:hypothetical protein
MNVIWKTVYAVCLIFSFFSFFQARFAVMSGGRERVLFDEKSKEGLTQAIGYGNLNYIGFRI